MAAYTAADCNGPFTLVECDANESENGAMPYLNINGLTAGEYLFIRVFDHYTPPNPFVPGSGNPCLTGIINISLDHDGHARCTNGGGTRNR